MSSQPATNPLLLHTALKGLRDADGPLSVQEARWDVIVRFFAGMRPRSAE
jgi:hypothetical protein